MLKASVGGVYQPQSLCKPRSLTSLFGAVDPVERQKGNPNEFRKDETAERTLAGRDLEFQSLWPATEKAPAQRYPSPQNSQIYTNNYLYCALTLSLNGTAETQCALRENAERLIF